MTGAAADDEQVDIVELLEHSGFPSAAGATSFVST
jgi:hypothetical protein